MAKKKEEDGYTESEPLKAGYVLASGVNMGQMVPCVVLALSFNEETKQKFGDLAKAETPDVVWQNQALYSDGNEPGTWHYV